MRQNCISLNNIIMKIDTKILTIIFISALLLIFTFAGGFFAGKQSAKPEIIENTTIVENSIPPEQLIPTSEQTPDISSVINDIPKKPPETIIYRDSIIYRIQEIDTLAIIAEYITRREYAIRIDTAGVIIELEPTVQFNRLQSMPYTLTRTDKEIVTTDKKERVVIPFVSVSCLTNGSNEQGFSMGAGGGLFIRDWGFEYQYLPTGNRHVLSFKRKF